MCLQAQATVFREDAEDDSERSCLLARRCRCKYDANSQQQCKKTRIKTPRARAKKRNKTPDLGAILRVTTMRKPRRGRQKRFTSGAVSTCDGMEGY